MKHPNHKNTKKIFGFNFLSGSIKTAVELICGFEYSHENKIEPLVFTPNTHIIVQCDKMRHSNPGFVNRLARSAIIFPDGFPILWSSRILRAPLNGTIAGADVLPELLEKVSKKRLLFIGPDEHTLAIAKTMAEKNFGHQVEYISPPKMKLYSDEFESVAWKSSDVIQGFNPHFVIVGLGFPKQEMLSFRIIDILRENNQSHIPLFMAFGASAEFYAGIKRRAPKFIRIMCMEWLYRFLQEPRRLFKRYFLNSFWFFVILAREFKTRLGRNGKGLY
jgi:N-acetylglucosaminyldiphosphoundecaprenol N-acetyl-beta-D-mannosaminyltransferase